MKIWITISILLFCPILAMANVVVDEAAPVNNDVCLIDSHSVASIECDLHDAEVVKIAAGLLADDFERVSGRRPGTGLESNAILIGTIGQSTVIDELISKHKVDVAIIKGQWESFIWQTVTDPLPGVHHALVIAGSDRRGTAYGVVELSKRIGVSPWYWWADVPPSKHSQLRVSTGSQISASPGVKYRGIFLNDEDWGLRPWASKTFDPESGKIGPKTYAKIFELMLRLRLNYIWPAMHPGEGSSEFSFFPGNAELADRWAIVTGSSHCEPMLRNNVFWPKEFGAWRYDTNHDAIFNYWKESASTHADYESIWTLGIRGIHDSAMEGPKDLRARVDMVERTIVDQRSLINQFVTKKYGAPSECFVPYKEVLALYDAGMTVPEDVTLVWPDDNFGYVRRLGTPAERKRPGGSGVYYHLSYWGAPHSYLWLESTSPGLMWEELRKLYDNDSKNIWIVNVGDIKPAEVCIDFFSNLAWQPGAWDRNSQEAFLTTFDASTFGLAGPQVHALQNAYYQLASMRKTEHISYAWLDSLSQTEFSMLRERYQSLLDQEKMVAQKVRADQMDSYVEMVGYSARMLGATGLLYSGDDAEAKKWKQYIDDQTIVFNEKLAGGKWHRMMSNTMEGVAWPPVVGGKAKPVTREIKRPTDGNWKVVDAADGTAIESSTSNHWQLISGLGWSGRAIAVLPATLENSWNLNHIAESPAMKYQFNAISAGDGSIRLHALPTLRLTPEGHLRVAVGIDSNPPLLVDIPGGSSDNELSKERLEGVQANRVTIVIATGVISAGKHSFTVYAIDPGAVLDQIEFPQ